MNHPMPSSFPFKSNRVFTAILNAICFGLSRLYLTGSRINIYNNPIFAQIYINNRRVGVILMPIILTSSY